MPTPRSASLQIEVLTKGVGLPLPAITPDVVEIVIEVMARAFSRVAALGGAALRRMSEAEINSLLAASLAGSLSRDHDAVDDLDVMWRQVATGVARGVESVSFDGRRLELRADLNVYLHGRHPGFPLNVECKLIDHVKRKTAGMYLKEGLIRFVRGDYAWAAREAVMLAYVSDGSSCHATLAPMLAPSRHEAHTASASMERLDVPPHDVARSIHIRSFAYPGQANAVRDPGPIAIWHLWLPLP